MVSSSSPALTSAEGRAARFSVAVAGIWLVFLVSPAVQNWSEIGEPRVAAAYVAAVVFAAAYLALFVELRRRRELFDMGLPGVQAWSLLAVMTGAAAVVCAGWQQSGTGTSIYIAVAAAMALPTVAVLLLLPLLAGAVVLATATLPGWSLDLYTPLVIVSGGFVMWAVKQILGRNVELVTMRAENERLLVDQERNRFARDLHDILGHSLTVLAVKAELAGRLLEADRERAAKEVADLERLCREALSDVRRAVRGYREITLPGEIARARSALDAAGIHADLPSSGDDVAGPLRELFAWTIREGVTNVIRHSRATRCTVELAANRILVCNDGPMDSPGTPREGHGLQGLRERAHAVGARMSVHASPEEGFVLEVAGP